jgi:hypothetical protein
VRLGGKQRGFGIVGAPVVPGTVPVVDATAYGFLAPQQLRTDRSGPDPVLDAAVEAIGRGDLPGVSAALRSVEGAPDAYLRTLSGLADLAVIGDGWLNAWLDSAPDDPHPWTVHAQAMVNLAWRLRTGAPAGDVLREQWAGFHRVLGQAPAACEWAAALAPELAAPWVVLVSCAQGIGWDHERLRGIWKEIQARAPYSVVAHSRALAYWLPRWRGSAELAAGFVAETLAAAAPGRLLTSVRLLYLFQERVPEANAEAFYRSPELAGALDAAIADLAASAPEHPFRANHRHWLAYFLTKAGRFAEAVAEFRTIDGYAGAGPWDRFADPVATLASTRADALLGWQRAGTTARSGAAGR